MKKSFLLPLLVNERSIAPLVIKKFNQFVIFKFRDVQFLDVLNFLGGSSSLDSFSKACKTSEAKSNFPYDLFVDLKKLNKTELPPYETFFRKLRNSNHLKKDYSGIQSLIGGGLTSVRNIIETEIETTTCNWTRKPPIFDLCVATRKYVYFQRRFALV